MIDELKQWEYDRGYEKGKIDVLDKIRVEIADLGDVANEGYYKAVTDTLQIIDKYNEHPLGYNPWQE